MTKVETANQNFLLQTIQSDFEIGKKLFKPEIYISNAYCNSLFEAGIFNRLECEKVKNGLQTVLKRAEFDRNFFDNSKATSIFDFIDEKLLHLVGEIGLKIRIGRSLTERISTALRLLLGKEITAISKTLREIQILILDLAEPNLTDNFLIEDDNRNMQAILFGHWCLSYFEILQKDRERTDEVWRRVSILPIGSNNGIGTSLEFDRQELADNIGFQRISTNSLEAFGNKDFMLEFVNLAALISTNLLRLIDEISRHNKSNYLTFRDKIESFELEIVRSKLKKMFSLQNELNFNLSNKNFTGNLEVVCEALELLQNNILFVKFLAANLSLNLTVINDYFQNYIPPKNEIFDYLSQRGENVRNAEDNSEKIRKYLCEPSAIEKTDLPELRKISLFVGDDFFFEMSLENNINSKNQIGGTSRERVLEAFEDAKSILKYEE